MKTKINQKGAHVIALLMAVCVLALIVLIGIKIFGGHKVAVGSKTEAQGASTQTVNVPPGWKLFADKGIGVQFIYPDVYGTFSKPTDKVSRDFDSALVSGRLTTDYLPGVAGRFTLGSYQNSTAEVTTRRFGPRVKLDGSDWIVVEPNQYDDHKYQKGDVYPEMTHANSTGIDVYTASSGDEGIITYNIYFVSQGKLRDLELPPFNSDLVTSTYNVNDRTPYDTMFAQVRYSIRLY